LFLRISYSEILSKVEYSITEKGKELIPILHQLCDWNKSIIIQD